MGAPVYKLAADILAGDPAAVREVIDLSNRVGYMVHGGKQSSLYSMHENGVLPLTPEGGGASYWNTGSRIFGVNHNGEFFTRDSTVFNYAH